MDVAGTHAVTQLLTQAGRGDPRAADQLLPLVYDELRRLAQSHLQGEQPGHTLQATALVHEAYLRLIPQQSAYYQDRVHFFRVAAIAIRRLLVEHARKQQRRPRNVNLDDSPTLCAEQTMDYGALNDVLERFAKFDAVGEQIVNLRHFAGLTMDQIAEAVGEPKRSVERRWTDAKAWLKRELETHA